MLYERIYIHLYIYIYIYIYICMYVCIFVSNKIPFLIYPQKSTTLLLPSKNIFMKYIRAWLHLRASIRAGLFSYCSAATRTMWPHHTSYCQVRVRQYLAFELLQHFLFLFASRLPPPRYKQQLASDSDVNLHGIAGLCDRTSPVELLSCEYTGAVAVHSQISNLHCVTRPLQSHGLLTNKSPPLPWMV